jgi:hypothetical protein
MLRDNARFLRMRPHVEFGVWLPRSTGETFSRYGSRAVFEQYERLARERLRRATCMVATIVTGRGHS